MTSYSFSWQFKITSRYTYTAALSSKLSQISQISQISKPVTQGQYVVSDTRCPALLVIEGDGKQGSGPEGDDVL